MRFVDRLSRYPDRGATGSALVHVPRAQPRRWRVGTWLLLLLLVIAYLAWPYWSATRLASALERGDREALDGLVDWPAVAEGLRVDLNGLLVKRMAQDGVTLSSAAAEGALMPDTIDDVASIMATPDGLAWLLSENGNIGAVVGGVGEGESFAGLADDLRARTSSAVFTSPMAFRVRLTPAENAANRPLVAVMRLRDGGWRLTRLFLPTTAPAT
ncbi:MAG: DUF2939 domain-containing protein [Geminicoccaceae bacterium]